jgi:hypothetical protein
MRWYLQLPNILGHHKETVFLAVEKERGGEIVDFSQTTLVRRCERKVQGKHPFAAKC